MDAGFRKDREKVYREMVDGTDRVGVNKSIGVVIMLSHIWRWMETNCLGLGVVLCWRRRHDKIYIS